MFSDHLQQKVEVVKSEGNISRTELIIEELSPVLVFRWVFCYFPICPTERNVVHPPASKPC